MIVRDEDKQWIVDFAGPMFRGIWNNRKEAFGEAREFVHRARDGFRTSNAKLFDRYSTLARYLDSRAYLWPT
jgi:hypothetical protein